MSVADEHPLDPHPPLPRPWKRPGADPASHRRWPAPAVLWGLAAAVAALGALGARGVLGGRAGLVAWHGRATDGGAAAGRFAPAAGAALRERGGVPVVAVVRRDFVRQVPAEGNLRALRSTRIGVPLVQGPMRIAWLAADGARVAAGEPVVRFDPSEVEKTLADGETDLASARLKADKERSNDRAAIAKLERDAAMAERELASAREFQKKDTQLFSRHDIIASDIDQQLAAEKQRVARAQEAASRAQQDAGLGVIDIDVRKAESEIVQARTALRAMMVAAPHAGIFVLQHDMMQDLPHVGDTVWPGQMLAEIPDLAEMQADVYVLEADAGGLAAGQPATVQIESALGSDLPARVAHVAAVPKTRLRGSPVQYFEVALQLTGGAPPERPFKPGERVSALLRLAERRDALVVPRDALFERDGRPVVYRWRPRGAAFDTVPVTLGPESAAAAVLSSGVAAGDLLALRDPTRPAAAAAARDRS